MINTSLAMSRLQIGAGVVGSGVVVGFGVVVGSGVEVGAGVVVGSGVVVGMVVGAGVVVGSVVGAVARDKKKGNTKQISAMTVTLHPIKLIDVRKILYKILMNIGFYIKWSS